VQLRARIPSLCAGSAAIFLAASGRVSQALSVLAIGLLAEIASALALAAQGAGEGLRAGLRQRLRRRVSGLSSRAEGESR
jgi:hypothetical protein